MRVYFGYPGWGWRMYGIGYKTKWFLGFSMQAPSPAPSSGEKRSEGGAACG